MRENAAFARSLDEGSRVLDAGAGDQPYRSLFAHCVYETADFELVEKSYARSTYVCDLGAIPVADGRFDAVICNQVFEHLNDPSGVMGELARVLRPGGRLLCTAPLFYEEHEVPYDFFRYTQFAWRRLTAEGGFEIDRIVWLEGYLGTVAYQFGKAGRDLPIAPAALGPGIWGWLAAPVVMVLKPILFASAWLFQILDEKHRYIDRGMPKNYLVLARKRS
jgi:SAM-dependent methyltransferase